MLTSKIETAVASKAWATVIGEYVWASRVGQDAVLRLDFGPPHLHIKEPSPRAEAFAGAARTALARRAVVPVGRWHLFIENGVWRVCVPGATCDRTDAERDDPATAKQIVKCLSLLDGQKLMAARLTASGSWQFDFDLGGALSIGVDPSDQASSSDAVWTLFCDEDSNLSYLPDRTFVLERAACVTP